MFVTQVLSPLSGPPVTSQPQAWPKTRPAWSCAPHDSNKSSDVYDPLPTAAQFSCLTSAAIAPLLDHWPVLFDSAKYQSLKLVVELLFQGVYSSSHPGSTAPLHRPVPQSQLCCSLCFSNPWTTQSLLESAALHSCHHVSCAAQLFPTAQAQLKQHMEAAGTRR